MIDVPYEDVDQRIGGHDYEGMSMDTNERRETLCVNCHRAVEHVVTSRGGKVWCHVDTGQMICQPSELTKAMPTWAEADPKPRVNMLCIRDPDYSNQYTFDVEVNEIEIDVGGNWRDYKDFSACLVRGEEEAVEYEASVLEAVSELAPHNPVRLAAESFFSEARNDG